jgi:curved DNA-binding protein
MDFKDYYQTLGIDKSADAETVKKAYRKLARKYHPDVSKEADAAARMSEVNEAYTVLSDPEKRAAYEALGQGRRGGQDFQPPPDWASGFEFSGGGPPPGMGGAAGEDFSDFFETLFGRARAGRGGFGADASAAGSGRPATHAARGGDHHASISIVLADAYSGATRTISLRGAHLGDDGRVVADERTIEVRIPKGVKEGQLIRLGGQGSAGRAGGTAGDLYLEMHFNDDARYRVVERDVHETVPVAPWEAALGAAIEVPTPAGPVEVRVPQGSQTGRRLRLKGRGIPAASPAGSAGDLYLELQVVLPPGDRPRARARYETMAREMKFDPRAGLGARP